MKNVINRFLTSLGSKDFLLVLVMTFAAYALIEAIGFFRVAPASYREVLHSLPSRGLSLALFLSAAAAITRALFLENAKEKFSSIFFFLSIILFCLSLWISIYTRFEGKTIRAEGQTFGGFKSDYIGQSIYNPNEVSFPQVGLTVHGISAESEKGFEKIRKIEADIIYASRTTNKLAPYQLSSMRPLYSDWTFVKITDFGYAPKYVLADLEEKELESANLYMRLFPPDTEDHFETMYLGYLFYLTIYPDFTELKGRPSTKSLDPVNPVYKLRIVRNKDIVYEGLLKPEEKVRFDNFVISFPKVKMWIEIGFVRDLGLPVAAVGVVFLLLSILMMQIAGKRERVKNA